MQMHFTFLNFIGIIHLVGTEEITNIRFQICEFDYHVQWSKYFSIRLGNNSHD